MRGTESLSRAPSQQGGARGAEGRGGRGRAGPCGQQTRGQWNTEMLYRCWTQDKRMPPCLLQARAAVPQTDGFGLPQAPAKRQTPGPRGRTRNPGADSPWPQALGGPPGLRSPSSQSGPAHSRGAARGPESPGLTAPRVQGLRPHHGDAHLQQPDSAPTTLS